MFLRFVKSAYLAMLVLMVAAPVYGQAARRCVDGKKLTLPVVEGYLARKQGAVAVARIEGCHVGFSLDAEALQELSQAGMPDEVFDALNRDTVGQMTPAQAHAEVAALEGQHGDAALTKLFAARIAYLKKAEYVVTEPFVRTQYTADRKLEEGKIGGVDYLFAPVTEAEDRVIAGSPKDLVVVRHYEEDAGETRVLRVASAHIQVSGKSLAGMRRGVVASALENMRNALKEGDAYYQTHSYIPATEFYRRAGESADQILGLLDKGNREAMEGKQHAADRLAAIQAALGGGGKPTVAAASGQANSPDVWVDAKTRLMWARKDNGRNVNWNVARDYCKASTVAGFSDWRLPEVEELRGIYDASADPEISDWKKHTKGGIQLTGAVVWSATRDNSTLLGEAALWVKFSDGSSFPDSIGRSNRVLCVRGN